MQACRDVLSPGVAGFRSADTLFVQNQRLHFAKLGEWKLVTLQTRRCNNEVLPLNRSDSQKFVFYGRPTHLSSLILLVSLPLKWRLRPWGPGLRALGGA